MDLVRYVDALTKKREDSQMIVKSGLPRIIVIYYCRY